MLHRRLALAVRTCVSSSSTPSRGTSAYKRSSFRQDAHTQPAGPEAGAWPCAALTARALDCPAHLSVQQLDAVDRHLSGRGRRLLGRIAAAGAALALGLRLLLVRLLLHHMQRT